MEQTARNPELAAFDSLVGGWTLEATHPMFPSTVVNGRMTYEWLEAKLSDDGATLAGVWQLSRDDETWTDDLAITFTRAVGAPGSQDS